MSHTRARRTLINVVEPLERRQLLTNDFPVTNGVATVAVVDLAGDGQAEIISLSSSSPNSLNVLSGPGDGTFPQNVSLSTAGVTGPPQAIATADFNQDGLLDAVVSTYNGLTILSGTGNAAAPLAITTTIGANGPVVTGDFDRDGLIDIAAGGTIYRNNGASGFIYNGGFASGNGLVSGDFNRDGILDLASVSGNSVRISLGNGFNGFVMTTTTVGTNLTGIVAGDFNRDGKTDLAVVDAMGGGAAGNGNVIPLLGVGDGTFTVGAATAVGRSPSAIAIGDLNGDRRPDLAVSNRSDGTVSVLLARSDGTFVAAPAVTITATPPGSPNVTPTAVSLGDVNGDGRLDMAVGYTGPTSKVAVRLGNGDGTFAGGFFDPAVTSLYTGSTIRAAAVGDFNKDGKADAAFLSTSGFLSIAYTDSTGRFTNSSFVTSGQNIQDVIALDFNGDGNLDLATVSNPNNGNSATVTVFLGNGTTGSFNQTSFFYTGISPSRLVTGDFNLDGKTDLAVTNNGSDTVSVLLNNGPTIPLKIVTLAAGQVGSRPFGIATGDFNGDGFPDLAVTDAPTGGVAGNLNVLFGDGSGTAFLRRSFTVGNTPQFVAALDLNGDGRDDLVVADANDSNVYGFVAADNNLFQTQVVTLTGATLAIAVGDFNSDGRPELSLAQNLSTAPTVTVLTSNSTGRLFKTPPSAVLKTAGALATGDFTGDGRTDLFVGDAVNGGSGISVLPNISPALGYATAAGGVATVSSADPLTVSRSGDTISLTGPLGTQRLSESGISRLILSSATTIKTDLGQAGDTTPISLTIDGGTTTVAAPQHLGALNVAAGMLAVTAGGNRVLRVTGLTVGTSARLDLNDNPLVYDYVYPGGQLAAVRSLIQSGRNGGAWTGPGLTSSNAAASATAAATLGYMEASDYQAIYGPAATFAGETLDSTAVIVKYGLYGDANFDGAVNFNDFLQLQAAFGQSGTSTAGGDFDSSGTTDFNDFLLLQANFGNVLVASGAVMKVDAGPLPAIQPPTPKPPVVDPPVPPPAKTGSISGTAFGDVNRNGKYDKGDIIAPGRTVWLDFDNDGIKDANEPSTVTDSKGNYIFKNLAAGKYRVRRVFPTGYVESTPAKYVTLSKGQAVGGVYIGSKSK